jgi:5-methylcytosine-specific restriction endonuclease McrA
LRRIPKPMNDQTLGLLVVLFLALIILGQKKRTRYIPAKSKRLAWARFYQEFYRNPANKGKKLRKKDYEFDHIIPFSKGGTNDPENIRVLLKKESRRKGAKTN